MSKAFILSVAQLVTAINLLDDNRQLEEAIGLKVNLFKRGLDKFIKDGLFKEVNPLVAAVMILGIQESVFEYFAKAAPETQEEIRNDVNEILLYGLLKV